MKIIIDGYNLLPRMIIKGASLEEKRSNMIEQLKEFLSVNKAEITVVFDGTRQESLHRGAEKRGPIKLIYSARGETADEVIVELIRDRTGKAREHMVVTSDNRVIKAISELSARHMKSEDFAQYFE